MKKVVSIMAIICLIVFSYPQIIVKAIAPTYELKTTVSTANYYDDTDLQTWSDNIIGYNGQNPSIDSIYTALSSYQNTEGYTTMMICLTSNGRLLVYEYDLNVVSDFVFVRTSSDVKIYFYSNGSNVTNAVGRTQEYRFDTHVWLDKYDFSYDYWRDGRYISSSTTRIATLWAAAPYYYNNQIQTVGGTLADNGYAQNFIENIQDDYVDFLSVDLPYTDSDGNTVYPPPTEINQDNSIAFRKIDLSTIYSYTAKAHCAGLLAWEIDPVGFPIIDENLAGWTMHYKVTCSYKWTTAMDTWIYQPFYSGGSAAGSVSWDIEIAPTGSIKANQQTFDIYDLLNNYQVSAGSLQEINDVALAVYALKQGKGSVWGDVFGQSGDDISSIASEISSKNLFSINGYSSSQINTIFNPTYSYALTHLDLQVVAYPVNNTAHIKGKTGTAKLNLVTNTASSYAEGAEVTDEDTGTDVVLPDYENNSDTVVQPVNSNGSIVYVVINNPLSGTSGSGSSSSSSSSNPSINVDVGGGTYAFDPGYEDLKNDIIAQDNNWATYFDPFVDEENGAGELTGTVLTYLPSEMKTIFISGFGVLTLLAIYRYIRRG